MWDVVATWLFRASKISDVLQRSCDWWLVETGRVGGIVWAGLGLWVMGDIVAGLGSSVGRTGSMF